MMSRVISTCPDIACSGPMQASLVLQAMSERPFQSTVNSATSCRAAHLHGGDLAWQGLDGKEATASGRDPMVSQGQSLSSMPLDEVTLIVT